VPPREKIGIARDILVAVDEADEEARVPDVAEIVSDRGDDRAHADLAGALQEQLDRAATNAFSRPFLVAALIALAALVPILFGRREAVPE
jgi:hypothetical protein